MATSFLVPSHKTCDVCGLPAMLDLLEPASSALSLRQTNIPPLLSDLQQVQKTLPIVESDILLLSGKRGTIVLCCATETKFKHDTLEIWLQQHVPILAPARKLPDEIYSVIFFMTLPEDWEENVQVYKRAVLLPGQVCRMWRNVALETRPLWSRMNFKLSKTQDFHRIGLAKTWLQRSGGYPISLKLVASRGNSRCNSHCPLFDILIAHCHRWKTVHVLLPISVMKRLFPQHIQLPLLHSLTVNALSSSEANDLGIWEKADLLRQLDIGLNVANRDLRAPWAQLTKLKLCLAGSGGDSVGILGQCTNLTSCDLRLVGFPESASDATTAPKCPVELAHLRKLIITSEWGIDNFLDRLILPQLSLFRFFQKEDALPWVQSQLNCLISRSICWITKLSISHCRGEDSGSVNSDAFLACLHMCPALRELELIREAGSAMQRPILNRMTPFLKEDGNLSAYLVPQLQSLQLEYTVPDTGFMLDLPALVTMLRARVDFFTSNTHSTYTGMSNASTIISVCLWHHFIPFEYIDTSEQLKEEMYRLEQLGLDIFWQGQAV